MFFKKLFPQKLKNYGKHLPAAVLANLSYQRPSKKLKLIGVTGTDGKTTTSYLIHYFLTRAGFKTGLVSSILAKIGAEEVSTGFHVTTPSPIKLQGFLKKMLKQKVNYAVLETTSHGWDQFRLWGCRFEVGVLTNITHEHLDYHHTYEQYLAAKFKLLLASQKAVVNADDESFDYIKRKLKKPTLTYGIKNQANLRALRIKQSLRGTRFVLLIEKGKFQGRYEIKTALLGEFNVANQLAAIGAGITFGLSPIKMAEWLLEFPGVVGRMENINNKKGVKAYIDFAHTPNALKSALTTLRQIMPKSKKLIVIFGAAGLRDSQKRPFMGQVAARLADYAVFTSEDPRTEDPQKIIKEISKGARSQSWKKLSKRKAKIGRLAQSRGFFVLPHRQEAINFAIRKLASKGDFVISCGKGHERSMCFGKTEYPWSEHKAVEVALKGRRKK